jgi:predicted MFS family arabinose efflux permease
MFTRTKGFIENNFHSLYHRDYRLFFFGQLISLTGTWIQVMAQAWLVYTITNSPLKLGIVSAVQFLPILAFSLFTGVLIDKTPKKRVVIATQVISMLQALTLFFLVHFGTVQYWHILLLAFILGCTNSIDMPARQSYVIELVGRKDVTNAVGLNSTIFNLARIVGPAIAGILMTGIGIDWCFLINALSFIAVIIGLVFITHEGYPVAPPKKESVIHDIRDGLLYVYRTPILLKTVLIIFFISVIGFNNNVLIPVFAKNILGLKEKGFGILLSAFGVGSVIGALTTTMRANKGVPRPRLLIISSLFLGAALFSMGFASSIYIASLVIALCGIFGIWFFSMANSILQLSSDDRYRGRVMSVYAMVFAGSTPVGSFMAGFLAEHVGVGRTFILAGIVIVLAIIILQAIRFTRHRKRTATPVHQ